jgi:hypothetical protein
VPHGTSESARRALEAVRSRTHRYTTLLVAELALMVIYPFFTGIDFRRVVFRGAAIVLFAAALYAVLGKGRATIIAFSLGLPAIVIRLFNLLHHASLFTMADEVLGLAFMVYVTSVMVWTIMSDASVTTDTLAGAVSAYMLIGLTFGLAYMLIGHLVPGSFRDTIDPSKQLTPAEYTFFSFVTLTTTGYGDIVPWLPHARAFAMLESILGIMYPALLIGRLVGLHGRKREPDEGQ